jgi:hypothetical protein
MNTEELAAMTIPNTIGTAKLATVAPPQIAIGSMALSADVFACDLCELTRACIVEAK